MTAIQNEMPILAKHEGVWEGYYRHLDTEGRLIDGHRSRLLCRFGAEAGRWDYHQTNLYFWDDGKKEVREYPVTYVPGSKTMVFTGEIDGWAKETTSSPGPNRKSPSGSIRRSMIVCPIISKCARSKSMSTPPASARRRWSW